MNHPHILTIVGVPPSNQRAPAGDAAAAARLARLCRGTAQLETLTQQMDVEATGDTGGRVGGGPLENLGGEAMVKPQDQRFWMVLLGV
jgi:hypothetical protein